MVDSFVRPPDGYESVFKSRSRFSTTSSLRSLSGIDNSEPYQAIIDKNLRSMRKRQQDNTREELTSVLSRVENTLVEYEKSVFTTDNIKPKTINEDTGEEEKEEDDESDNELEAVVHDKIDSFRYKQKIIVFIMGQTEAVKKKNMLLAELNTFFNDQRANFDPSQINITEIDFDFDEVKVDMDQCLGSAKIMMTRLDELNENIVQYLINNSGNKQAKVLIERSEEFWSKKKLEKSLVDAKNELNDLTSRLEVAQTELTERDEKIETLIAQLELKREFMKKSDSSSRKDIELHLLKTKLRKQDLDIRALKKKLSKSQIDYDDLTQEIEEVKTEQNVARMWKNDPNNPINIAKAAGQASKEAGPEGAPTETTAEGASTVTATVSAPTDGVKPEVPLEGAPVVDTKNDDKLSEDEFEVNEDEISQFRSAQENDQMKKDYEKKLEIANSKLRFAELELEKFKKARATQATATSRSEKVMGRKSKGKKKAAAEEESAAGVVIVVDKPPEFDWAALKADILSADDEAVVEVPVGKKRKKGKKSKKNAKKGAKKDSTKEKEEEEVIEELPPEPVQTDNAKQLELLEAMENGGPIEDIDLTTEDWTNVQPLEMPKRYDALRRYANAKINAMKTDYKTLESTDREKIDKLKRQYLEHKKHWETERMVLVNTKDMEFSWDQERETLMNKAEVAFGLQQEAQNLAEEAIHELEDFISDDARLDRENAESALQILRERSTTLSALSAKADANMTDDAKIQESSEHGDEPEMIIKQPTILSRTGSKIETRSRHNSHAAQREKIPIILEMLKYNSAIKFPDRKTLEDLIEYVNSDMTNKFTLVINNTISRPGTSGSSSFVKGQLTPVRITPGMNLPPIERKASRSYSQSNAIDADNNNDVLMFSQGDDEVFKVQNDEDALINEMRHTITSRNSLRSAHLKKLEETKSQLNDIKNRVVDNFIKSKTDMEFPNIDKNGNEIVRLKTPGERREEFISRMNSAKSGHMGHRANSNMLSHPIVLEYIKTYDIIHNFKDLITRSIPANSNRKSSLFSKFNEKLTRLDMMEFNNESKVTPQIVQMTTHVDQTLNEIQTVFTQLVDELVSSKFDIFEKDHQLQKSKSRPNSDLRNISPTKRSHSRGLSSVSRPHTGERQARTMSRNADDELSAEKKDGAKSPTNIDKIKKLERELYEKQKLIEQLKSNKDDNIRDDGSKCFKTEDTQTEGFVQENKEQSDLYLLSQKQYPIQDELITLKENYKDLEKQYVQETQAYKDHINTLNNDIGKLSEAVTILKKELDQHRSVQFGLSRSNTCTPTISRKTKSPILPSIMPSNTTINNQTERLSKPPCIMFTKIDADRNRKRLKRALNRGLITDKVYEKASKLMDNYISIPSERLFELVNKYIAHKQAKIIMENISKDEDNEERIELSGLDKMSKVQQKRNSNYKERVNALHRQRISLAYDLTESLDDIERQSGIFLIKPFYSYQGKNLSDEFMRTHKLNKKQLSDKVDNGSNLKYYRSDSSKNSENMATWNVEDSFIRDEPSSANNELRRSLVKSPISNLINTPKMLELDVNRMIISQNQASSSVNSNEQKPSLRSYLAIDRSTGAANVEGAHSNTIRTMLYDARSVSGLSNQLMIEDKRTASPLPPIKLREHVNQEINDIMDVGSIGTGSGSLSRANTDVDP